MGSTRLPGKILMKMNGISLLQCLFNQLQYSQLIDENILATTTNVEDDAVQDFANANSIKLFRGNSLDVLDRYYQCAKYYSADHIVRITSDCPLIDPVIADQTIDLYKQGSFDYVNNFYKRTFPSGTEVEVFSFNTLERAWKNANKMSEREHVTPYIYNNPELFKISHIEYKKNISKMHWAVDRIEDLQLVTALYCKIQKSPILLQDILQIIENEPSILDINKNTNPQEGYMKSLQSDK